MTDHPTDQLVAFESSLTRIPGITHARMVTKAGRVTELHVVSDGLIPAKSLRRNIESVARAAFDIDLDYRVISIAEVPGLTDNAEQYERRASAAVALWMIALQERDEAIEHIRLLRDALKTYRILGWYDIKMAGHPPARDNALAATDHYETGKL